MTDLKDLLDEAAGADPVVTDTDLSADLERGRRALRRRRAIGIASGAVATALVIGVGWSVLPSGTATDGTPAPVARTTATPAQRTLATAKPFLSRHADDQAGLPPIPAVPVPLVANTQPFPGAITCDLIPKGWAVKLTVTAAQGGGWEQKVLTDPSLRNPKQYRDTTYSLTVRQVDMIDNGEGLTADKYTEPWTKLPKVRAGKNEAVISLGNSRNGLREVHVRQGRTTRLVAVSNQADNLAWDEATLLKFAGSCHYK